jgi:hypothetical protein
MKRLKIKIKKAYANENVKTTFVKSKTKHGRIKSKVFMRVCLLGLPCGFYVC